MKIVQRLGDWAGRRRDAAVHGELHFVFAMVGHLRHLVDRHRARAAARIAELDAEIAKHAKARDAHRDALKNADLLAANVTKLFTEPL